MRSDFNKLLVERERAGHRMHFGETRNCKRLNEKDEWGNQYGGREGMRRRHKIHGDTKTFNENLNPLKGFLHSKLGKKWDKVYSELRKTFDARGVINNHILEHLFDYVEVNTKVVDGVVMVLTGYKGSRGYEPIKKKVYNSRYPDYYVCPKDGTLKSMMKQSRRSIIKEKEAQKRREKEAKFRVLDANTHVLKIDDVWYVCEVEDLPPIKYHYEKPLGVETFKIDYFGKKLRTWEELNEEQRARLGIRRITDGVRVDAVTGERVHLLPSYPGTQHVHRSYSSRHHDPSTAGINRYYSSKRTASHKILKAVGIVS